MNNVDGITHHISLRTLRLSLYLMGMWPVESLHEQHLSNILLVNTVMLMIMAVVIESFDLYSSWGDLHAVSYNVPNTTTVATELLKLIQFVFNRNEVMKFNGYTEKRFWKTPYDVVEHQILLKCNRQSLKMILIYIFFAQSVVCLYCAIPIFEAAGKNVSERMLPFDLHLNLPLKQTPYYETAFLIEAAGMMSVGLCTTGFAGFLCTTNLYTAGQFKILQRRLELACDDEVVLSRIQTKINLITPPSKWLLREPLASNSGTIDYTNSTKVLMSHAKTLSNNKDSHLSNLLNNQISSTVKNVSQNSKIDSIRYTPENTWDSSIDNCRASIKGDVQYKMLKDCIKQHQILLKYVDEVEDLSSAVMLVLAFGTILKICFSGFQILLVGGTSILRTMLSIQFVLGTLFHFFMFSWSCHEIMNESQTLAEAVYRTSWYSLPYTEEGKACRQSLLIIIARAHKPCIITVGKFAPMSLRTFVSVLNTSISYFTILRQMNTRLDE